MEGFDAVTTGSCSEQTRTARTLDILHQMDIDEGKRGNLEDRLVLRSEREAWRGNIARESSVCPLRYSRYSKR